MNEHNENLCKGLHMIFLGNILGLVLAVLAMLMSGVPVLASVLLGAVMVTPIIILLGLFRLRTEHSGYAKALILMAVSFALGILSKLFQDGSAFQTVLTVVQSIVGMLETYLVIRATNSFLEARGLSELVADGKEGVERKAVGYGPFGHQHCFDYGIAAG